MNYTIQIEKSVRLDKKKWQSGIGIDVEKLLFVIFYKTWESYKLIRKLSRTKSLSTHPLRDKRGLLLT